MAVAAQGYGNTRLLQPKAVAKPGRYSSKPLQHKALATQSCSAILSLLEKYMWPAREHVAELTGVLGPLNVVVL